MFPYLVLFFVLWTSIGNSFGKTENYCSFFGNRAPSPQPFLKNCTWYRENSCCLQDEIDALFSKIKPLQGSSRDCQRYINYLICHVCDPTQNRFYQQLGYLYVCKEFCNQIVDKCGSAIMKGSPVSDLYSTGSEFCENHDLRVSEIANGDCFYFDEKRITSSDAVILSNSFTHIELLSLAILFNVH